MALAKSKNGKTITLSNSQIKAETMKIRGWTTEQYNKEYDKLRNKVRAYEQFEKAHGVSQEKINIAELMNRMAKTEKKYGAEYSPSARMRRIKASTSASTGKTKAVNGHLSASVEKRQQRAYNSAYGEETSGTKTTTGLFGGRFDGFINANEGAQWLVESISDPVQLEKALSDYANALHKMGKTGGGVTGDSVGSDSVISLVEYLVEQYSD